MGICGSGGGSGIPMTPYKKDEIIAEEKVSEIRSISKAIRTAILPKPTDDSYYDKYFIGTGIIYLQNEKDLQYFEELDNLPDDFKFDDFGVKKISFDKNTNKLVLNGLMSIQERNLLLNRLSNQTADKDFRKRLRTAVNKLFFLPRMINEVLYYLEGYSEGNEKQIIYLSEIEKIMILEVDKVHNKLLIEVVKFPDISPNELLSIKPTYTKLKGNYTTELKIWVNSVNEKGEELYIAEAHHKNDPRMDNFFGLNKDWFDEKEYFVGNERKLIKFQKDDEIKFSYENKNIWWAIPSVTNDIEYPHRFYFAH
jgi:hypothetical protein